MLDVLWRDESQHLEQTAYTQPALFAVEYALAKLWTNWGIEPAAVPVLASPRRSSMFSDVRKSSHLIAFP